MTQRLRAALSPLDAALRLLLDGVKPIEAKEETVANSFGCVAAESSPLQTAHPAFNIAVSDGWALRAHDIVGASSYSPVPLAASPVWVEAGDRLPSSCDCVLDADVVEQTGPMFQVLADAVPGHGIRRAGDDIAAGRSIIAPGTPVDLYDLFVVRAAGIDRISVRSPRVGVIDIPSADGNNASSQLILELAKEAGARVTGSQAAGRDLASISAALDVNACDLVVTVGGTGTGRSDATISALVARGAIMIHGLALQPGRTAAVGRMDPTPVIAVPGAPDQALAAFLMLVQPALDRLTARSRRRESIRPLARKISSSIGVTELVLLQNVDEAWMPIAVGQLSLDAISRADAWLAVAADSEGYAAGTQVGALVLRDTR